MKKAFLLPIVGLITLAVGCVTDPSGPNSPFPWSTSSPAEQGINPLLLDSAYIAASKLLFVDGLVVIRNGYLVREEYYNGYHQDTPHQIFSDTKSFMSALVGIALRDGFIESLDKKILDYFPEMVYTGMDPRFFNITVRHLLTMRMGIDVEEKNLLPIMATDNWVRETLKLPLISDPGQRFSYNSLQTHLLSAILSRTSKKSALEFARRNLTDPMGIEIASWREDPQGYNNGGFDIYMRPRDMAVLGYLYLNGGKMRGDQIIPKEWVDESLKKTWASDAAQWGPLTNYNYGYLWWLGKINGYTMFMAFGLGGQYIIVFPDLNLIVVTTADTNISWDNQQEIPILDVVSKYVLTAVIK